MFNKPTNQGCIIANNKLIDIPDLDAMKNNLQEYIDYLENEIRGLATRITEYNKDEEIVKRDKEIQRLSTHALSMLSDNELNAIKNFKYKHCVPNNNTDCCNSDSFWYKLTSTGFGTAITIKCDKCGEEMNITDFTDW